MEQFLLEKIKKLGIKEFENFKSYGRKLLEYRMYTS